MGMTNEEREKHIRIANMLIGAINDLIRPILLYQIEKDVAKEALENYIKMLEQQPCEDVGELSDGYHTFNQLYHQRAVLFACIVKQNKNKAWKSFKHSDGKYCFDSNGEWFIVGVDTPQGSYTYHYAKEYWDMFDCQELECGKEWDGHTEDDVTRLLSLEQQPCEDVEEYGMNEQMESSSEKPNKSENPTSWISVSERLPKDLEPVNITWVNHNPESYYADIKDKPFTATGVYFNGQWYWWSALCTDILAEYSHNYDDVIDDDIEIIAWCEMPEPYKAESEDKK